jgi:hypothetical protein
MTTTINYTLPSGRKAEITVKAVTLRGKVHAEVIATVDGMRVFGGPNNPDGLPAWAASCIGRPSELPLTAEMDAAVVAAKTAIVAEYAEQNAAYDVELERLEAVNKRRREAWAKMQIVRRKTEPGQVPKWITDEMLGI